MLENIVPQKARLLYLPSLPYLVLDLDLDVDLPNHRLFLSLKIVDSIGLWSLAETEVVDMGCFREGRHQ